MDAEQIGLNRAAAEDADSPVVQLALQDMIDAHVAGFSLAFYASAGIALVGALACLILVRKTDRDISSLNLPLHPRRILHRHPWRATL